MPKLEEQAFKVKSKRKVQKSAFEEPEKLEDLTGSVSFVESRKENLSARKPPLQFFDPVKAAKDAQFTVNKKKINFAQMNQTKNSDSLSYNSYLEPSIMS